MQICSSFWALECRNLFIVKPTSLSIFNVSFRDILEKYHLANVLCLPEHLQPAIDTPFLLICKVLTFHEHLRFPLQFGYRTSILLSFSSVSLSLLFIAFSSLRSTSFFLGNMGSVFLMLNTVIQTCAPEVNWKHIIAKNEWNMWKWGRREMGGTLSTTEASSLRFWKV